MKAGRKLLERKFIITKKGIDSSLHFEFHNYII